MKETSREVRNHVSFPFPGFLLLALGFSSLSLIDRGGRRRQERKKERKRSDTVELGP